MPFLIILYAVTAFSNSALSKTCSTTVTGGRARYAAYYSVHSFIACIFYTISSGFNLSVNLPTLIYSVVFALLILANMLVSMLILRRMNVLGAGILSTPLRLIVIATMGALLFGESITSTVIIRITLMSVAAVLIFIDVRKRGKKKSDSSDKRVDLKKYLPLMLLSVMLNASQTIVTKSFAVSTVVTDENSFYLLTNVVMLLVALIMLSCELLRYRESVREALGIFQPKRILPTVGNVVSSNINSLVIIPILAVTDVAVFTPLTSAYGIVVGVMVSLLFREKLGIYSYLAAAVAIITMLVAV